MAGGFERSAQTFFEYGPFALVFILMYPIERKARSLFGLQPFNRKIAYGLYIAVWLGIFLAMAFALWSWREYHSEFRIKGELIGLESGDTLESQSDFFTSMERGQKGVILRYLWRLESPKQWNQQRPYTIFLDISPAGESGKDEHTLFYDLPIKPEYFNSPTSVHLNYERATDKLTLRYASDSVELSPSARNRLHQAVRGTSFSLGSLISQAVTHTTYAQSAQSAPNFKDLTERLESKDAYTRLVARSELAKMGGAAKPFVEEVLTDENSTDRLRLGVISALNQMDPTPIPTLSPTIMCVIAKIAHGYASTLRDEASSFIQSRNSGIPAGCNVEDVPFCSRPNRINVHVNLIFEQTSFGFFYLWDISSSDVADVYFVVGRPPGNLSRGRLSHSGFKTLISRLKLQPSGDLTSGTYRKYRVENNDRIDVRDPSGSLVSVRVAKTHTFKEFMEADVCK